MLRLRQGRNDRADRGKDRERDKNNRMRIESQCCTSILKEFPKGNWRPQWTWNETHQFHAVSSRKPSLTAPSNRNYGFCLEGAGLYWATKKMRSPRDREPAHRCACVVSSLCTVMKHVGTHVCTLLFILALLSSLTLELYSMYPWKLFSCIMLM